jgi:hypothetical protein
LSKPACELAAATAAATTLNRISRRDMLGRKTLVPGVCGGRESDVNTISGRNTGQIQATRLSLKVTRSRDQ